MPAAIFLLREPPDARYDAQVPRDAGAKLNLALGYARLCG